MPTYVYEVEQVKLQVNAGNNHTQLLVASTKGSALMSNDNHDGNIYHAECTPTHDIGTGIPRIRKISKVKIKKLSVLWIV